MTVRLSLDCDDCQLKEFPDPDGIDDGADFESVDNLRDHATHVGWTRWTTPDGTIKDYCPDCSSPADEIAANWIKEERAQRPTNAGKTSLVGLVRAEL